jgi:hypothetical protein
MKKAIESYKNVKMQSQMNKDKILMKIMEKKGNGVDIK